MNDFDNKIIEFRAKENFPVASILLPKNARKIILDFYKFARAADEIADNPYSSQAAKIADLQTIYDFLKDGKNNNDFKFIEPLIAHTKTGNINIKNCLYLLEAFLQDAEGKVYNNFDDLILYCQKSAAPVGRVVLDACAEYQADYNAANSICCVLQILNHLQDVKNDYINLQRLYFSKSYFTNLDDIIKSAESNDVKKFKADILGKVLDLLDSAKHLPQTIKSKRLRVEIQTIINICYALHKKLLHNDILKQRVELTKTEKLICASKALKALFYKSTKQINQNKLSSFFLPLLKLPNDKKLAMLSFYEFCRLVDDAVDDSSTIASAEEKLAFWQNEIEAIYSNNNSALPTTSSARSLQKYIIKYNLPKNILLEIIAGQKLDLSGKMIAPNDALFEDYCYKVAACVGLISVEIFGYNPENKTKIQNFAVNLGHALQIINIMRDVEEDAAKGRIYLPSSLLQNTKLANITPFELYQNFSDYKQDLKFIFDNLAKKADFYFEQAKTNLPKNEYKNMKVALLISKVYELYFEKMRSKNFIFDKKEIKLTKLEKLTLFKS